MIAWLYTILRNEYYSEFRKRRYEVGDEDGRHAARMAARPTQEGHMQYLDFRAALDRLAPDHREALILVGASGLSYEEAAARQLRRRNDEEPGQPGARSGWRKCWRCRPTIIWNPIWPGTPR